MRHLGLSFQSPVRLSPEGAKNLPLIASSPKESKGFHFHNCADRRHSQDQPFCSAPLSSCFPHQPLSQTAWSCVEGPVAALQTSSKTSSVGQSFTSLGAPWGSTQSQRLKWVQGQSHWEIEVHGWAVSIAQPTVSPSARCSFLRGVS